MTVLMLGWEFPPHIAGGLGTACQGLTQALTEEKTKVWFVVPKLFGDEAQEGIDLISASNVKTSFAGFPYSAKKKMISPFVTTTHSKPFSVSTDSIVTTIQINSTLVPYQSPDNIRLDQRIEQWNYPHTIDHYSVLYSNDNTEDTSVVEIETEHDVNTTYSFSGGYGATLMDEVSRYAQVASALPDQYSFDVIHAHDWMTYPAGIAAKKRSGKPLIVHVHATEHDRATRVNKAVYAIEKKGMEMADRVVAVSLWTKNIIIERYKIPKEKIDVVHNGIIHENSFPTALPVLAPVGSHIITFLGRITHQKGPYYFVEAARKVIEQFPDAHFVMAGSGDLFPHVIERVAQLKLSSHFHFTGFLKKKQMDQILSLTHVYVMPSVSEPFGITPLEAIRAGVPVIISNQSGVGEVMPHALKVDFWDSNALANAICSVLKYESLSMTLKKNSSREIKNITWIRAAKKLNTIYHELIKNNLK
jgi:glycogen(starch) synthase